MRKWRNRFQSKKIVVLAEYFEQQTNCSRYRRKMSQSTGEVFRRGISPIYLSSSNKWKPRNLRTALEKYFRFQWNCKKLRTEARNSMANPEIYFKFSLKLYIQFSKHFRSMILGKLGQGYCQKNRVLQFLAKIFG